MRKVSIIITYLGIPRFKSGENRYSGPILTFASGLRRHVANVRIGRPLVNIIASGALDLIA
jgi:hypothetical protein